MFLNFGRPIKHTLFSTQSINSLKIVRSTSKVTFLKVLNSRDFIARKQKRPYHSDIKRMGSQFEIPLDSPIVYLQCGEAFSGLTDDEKKFTHHLSRASWWGNFIVFCQKSPESPVIFSLLTRLFRSEPLNSLNEIATEKAKFTEDEFKGLLTYYSAIAYNGGNYLGFGDRKFVPSVNQDKLVKLIRNSKSYLEASDTIDKYLALCLEAMYDLSENKKFLALPEKGVTMYFTPNCNENDAALVKKYLASKNIEAWNTRVVKHEESGGPILDIRSASILKNSEDGITIENDEFEGHKFRLSRGDYSFFLQQIIQELELAKKYANALENKMLNSYIEHFKSGSIKSHKEGSAHWVKNKSPAVETYMGFIEAYTDPVNQRAEFESFVAVVNREQSRKLDLLVSRAEKEFLPLLPWGSDFEDDVFMQPDFSSLDVITFATSGLPIGINIPNYKDVKEEIGFKNVTLANVMSSRSGIKGGPFLSKEDHEIREKFVTLSLDIQVGLHELLGHGCGKFLRRKEDGTLNFDPAKIKNPYTGEDVTYYEKGENYNNVFTDISSSYEECRAENVALYLGLNDDVLDIFGVKEEDRDDVKYVIWLDMFYAGLKGLEMYQPGQQKWGQAHAQARFVLLKVALETCDGLVNVSETVGEDGLPDLLLTVDRSKIGTVGKSALGDFLKKLQVYRSMADVNSARKMYHHFSEVKSDGPYPFAKWHEIVVRKRRPRMVLSMANTTIGDDGNVKLVSYPDGVDGIIKSWVDRFSATEYNDIEKELVEFSVNYTK